VALGVLHSSQVEQYDFDIIDEEEALCDASRRMVIGDIRPQDSNENPPSSNEAAPLTHANDQDQDQEDEVKTKTKIKIKVRAMIRGE
jgi:hypothetical protein